MCDDDATKSEMEEGSDSVCSNSHQTNDNGRQSRLNENASNVAGDFSQVSGSDGGLRTKSLASRQKGRSRLTAAGASAVAASAVRTTKDDDTDSDTDGDARYQYVIV